jgi:hypothetical protein
MSEEGSEPDIKLRRFNVAEVPTRDIAGGVKTARMWPPSHAVADFTLLSVASQPKTSKEDR